jgi:inorganic pyrophosphatase
MMTDTSLFTAIIEDPNGSYTHMEYNNQTGRYEVVHNFKYPWPFHYGYVKGTMVGSDEDPLDLAIFGDFESQTGQEILVRIIGAAVIRDGDHKVFGVNPNDGQYGHCMEYMEIPEELRQKGEGIFARGGHEIEEILDSASAVLFVRKYMTSD